VTFLGQYDPHVKLHQVWDNSLINFSRGNVALDSYSGKLNQKITSSKKTEWEADMAPRTWAKESHELAKKYAYPPVLEQEWSNDVPVKLDLGYANAARPVVETQLMKAGVRLAKVLNDALAP
jgi:hypothetical protein